MSSKPTQKMIMDIHATRPDNGDQLVVCEFDTTFEHVLDKIIEVVAYGMCTGKTLSGVELSTFDTEFLGRFTVDEKVNDFIALMRAVHTMRTLIFDQSTIDALKNVKTAEEAMKVEVGSCMVTSKIVAMLMHVIQSIALRDRPMDEQTMLEYIRDAKKCPQSIDAGESGLSAWQSTGYWTFWKIVEQQQNKLFERQHRCNLFFLLEIYQGKKII